MRLQISGEPPPPRGERVVFVASLPSAPALKGDKARGRRW